MTFLHRGRAVRSFLIKIIGVPALLVPLVFLAGCTEGEKPTPLKRATPAASTPANAKGGKEAPEKSGKDKLDADKDKADENVKSKR